MQQHIVDKNRINKSFFIKTYGCQMNVYDSEKIHNIMENMHFVQQDTYNNAGIVIINTCHIRDKATEKMYSEIGRINRAKMQLRKEGKDMIIAIVGCVAQAEGEEIFARTGAVDLIIGPESYQNLPQLIDKLIEQGGREVCIDFNPNEKFDFLAQENQSLKIQPSAFVTIQEGCDKFCSFCVVPYTRGAEFSRNIEQIIDDIKRLADNGTSEITFLGQNVNAFHGKDSLGKSWKLSQLIAKTTEISSIKRIRYTTSHPNEMTDDLIAMHSDPKLMPCLNLPVQSGSDKILKAMNRNYTAEEYIKIIEKLKKIRPDIIFSSDFIIGFPGETNDDFQQTIALINAVEFKAQCYSFKYSPRPGTPAANKTLVDDNIQTTRLKELQNLLEHQQHSFNQSLCGKNIEVLFDSLQTKTNTQIRGRTPHGQIAIVNLPQEFARNRVLGTIQNCIINTVNTNSFICSINIAQDSI
jgi:tRNA-2-methylthio-N6-dimethylallyladenosine synthase